MIADATCAPSNIRFPQDGSLLNEAREWTEKIIDALHDPKIGRKPRTYRQLAHKTHSVPDRIVSLSQPFLRPIVRGKTRSPVEFEAKLDISVVDGFARLEVLSFNAHNEATQRIPMMERYRQRTGYSPKKVLADKIYRNRANLQYCKMHGIHLSGPRLGRPPADAADQKKRNYIDACARIEVERRFSPAKRKCGMGLIMTKLEDTMGHSIAMSIVVLNLRKLGTLLLRCLCFLRFQSRFVE